MVNKIQLRDLRQAKHERVQVVIAHGPIEAVHGKGQRQPRVDDLLHPVGPIGIGTDLGRQRLVT
jgi:hypothetical protein